MILKSSYNRALLKEFAFQKFITSRLLTFALEEGILSLIESLKEFQFIDIVNSLKDATGYKLHDTTRRRMIKIIIDLLHECELLRYSNGIYLWNAAGCDCMEYNDVNAEALRESFGGKMRFFGECISYAGKFLRGAPPLFKFDGDSLNIWEEFLGDHEFSFARAVLLKLLSIDGRRRDLLDLCYGPGFDILQMEEELSNTNITAIDFTDIFHDTATGKLNSPGSINWINPESWSGFGSPLPFNDNSFDVVFFACADPYIPPEKREDFYRDIYRILRYGGSLGIVTNCYPDKEERHIKEKWLRRGVLCHDFLESVCAGWHGFYDAEEHLNIADRIGYKTHTIMLNASIWKFDK